MNEAPNPNLLSMNRALGETSRLDSEFEKFEPLNIYDAPDVIISQMLGGEASWRSIKDTLLNPNNLSPSERTSLAQRFLSGQPEGVGKALMKVATNPWVWLMFVTSPVGAKALQAGKSLFTVNKEFSGFLKKASGWFHNLLTPLEEFGEAQTVVLEVSEHIGELNTRARALTYKAEQELLGHFDQLLGRKGNWAGASPLSPSSYAKGSEEYEMVRKWAVYDGAKNHGLDRIEMSTVPELKYRIRKKEGASTEWRDINPMEDLHDWPAGVTLEALEALKKREKEALDAGWDLWRGLKGSERDLWISAPEAMNMPGNTAAERGFQLWHDRANPSAVFYDVTAEVSQKSVERHALVRPELMTRWEGEFGDAGRRYREAAELARKDAFVEFVGDRKYYELTGDFKADEEKVFRVISSLQREMGATDGKSVLGGMHAGSTSLQGKEALMSLLGVERLVRVKGAGRGEQLRVFKQMLEEVVGQGAESSWAKGTWASRNTLEAIPVQIAGQRRPPSMQLETFQRKNLDLAPHASSSSLSGHVMPVTEKEILFHPEDLEFLDEHDGLTRAGQQHLKEVEVVASRAWAKDKKAVLGMRLDGEMMHRQYLRNVHQGTAFDSAPAGLASIKEDSESISKLHPEVLGRKTVLGPGVPVSVEDDILQQEERIQRRFSRGDLLDRFYQRQLDPTRQQRIREVLIPGALNNAGPEYISVYNHHLRTRELAGGFANSGLGKLIEKGGAPGRAFISKLRDIGDMSRPVRADAISDGLAKWFYVTHLGVNMSSMIMNMTQPLLLASSIGNLDDVVGAFSDSVKDMANYAKLRVREGGVFLAPERKIEILGEALPFTNFGGKNLIGVGPDIHALLDSHLARTKGVSRLDRVAELMMKGFEKTEWFNRNTSAHLLKRVYAKAGRNYLTDPHFATDLQRFVLQTQFGQNDLNTPLIFQKGVMANPLLRQFLTFPLRSFTGAVDVFPKIGGEDSYLRGLSNTVLRGMGVSAIVYEAGKGLMGADLSRGLFASSVTDMFEGDRLLEGNANVVPLPPVVDVPISLIRGVAGSDMGLLSDAIARTVPGGVAINRMLGMAPALPRTGSSGFPGNLQKTFVGWDQVTPDGLVPVFKGDGSLIEYRSRAEVVAKAMGADMGQWGQQGALDGYLLKQRDQILGMRQEFLRALASNEYGRAMGIKQQFEEKFKVPLTVNKRQVEAFMGNRVTSRTERVLDSLPPEVRRQYAGMAAASGVAPQLPRQSLVEQETAKQRDAMRPRQPGAFDQFSQFGR